ncbi:MAG: Holliday junction resolvase RuvX [Pseudomonadota bacterium]
MAFDYGLRQIGVAVGNTNTQTSAALTVIPARDGIPDWAAIAALLNEWQADHLIVGLPLNMDDSESELSQRARKFGRRLEGRFSLPVSFVDERLSSAEAKALLKEQGHRGDYRARPADALAAQLILDTWLTEQSSLQ